MKKELLCSALCLLATTTLPAQNTVWFDQPTSLKGRAAWYGGHPENFTNGRKPVNAGDFNGNSDPEWEQRSLPLGNGSIGANVMGSVAVERITLNEKTLWRGGPGTAKGAAHYWNVNKQSAPVLKEIRQAFAEGDDNKAARLTRQNFNSPVPYEALGEPEFRFGSFTTMGELCIETGINPEGITSYRRALSVDSAYATVSFASNGLRYERRTFISYPDNVLAIRFSASQPGKQNLRLTYDKSPVSEGQWTADGTDGLCFKGRLDNNGMEYVVRLKALTQGGTVSNAGNALTVKGADEVVFLLTADTDYRPNYDPDFNDPKAYVGTDPSATTARWMKNAAKKSFAELFKTHYKDYASLFGRVRFHLAGKGSELPTDRRLAAYRNGATDPALETLYYQYGRYLLIASSRPGNLPANLQGIWHNNVDGPWRVDYHNNINLQMNYWPSLPTNLTECAEPLTDFIRLLRKPGRETARAYFGARGWAANIFGFTAPLRDQDMSWNYNPMAASWLATHLWDYYDYTRDTDFLRDTAYPIMKECAQFTEDFLWHKPDGTYTAAPSTSPEHGPIDQGTTFTHAVAREILIRAIEAARILGKDETDVKQWENVLAGIVPYRIGRYGQLLEWSRDIDDPNDHHRHVNHLFGAEPPRRRGYRMEHGMEAQPMGTSARRRPLVQALRQPAQARNGRQPLGRASALPDRRQFRRNGRRDRNAAAKPRPVHPPAARPAHSLARGKHRRPARARQFRCQSEMESRHFGQCGHHFRLGRGMPFALRQLYTQFPHKTRKTIHRHAERRPACKKIAGKNLSESNKFVFLQRKNKNISASDL